jgi:hypothetical protein
MDNPNIRSPQKRENSVANSMYRQAHKLSSQRPSTSNVRMFVPADTQVRNLKISKFISPKAWISPESKIKSNPVRIAKKTPQNRIKISNKRTVLSNPSSVNSSLSQKTKRYNPYTLAKMSRGEVAHLIDYKKKLIFKAANLKKADYSEYQKVIQNYSCATIQPENINSSKLEDKKISAAASERHRKIKAVKSDLMPERKEQRNASIVSKTLKKYRREEWTFSDWDSDDKDMLSKQTVQELAETHTGSKIYKQKYSVWANKRPTFHVPKIEDEHGTLKDTKMALLKFVTKRIKISNALMKGAMSPKQKFIPPKLEKIEKFANEKLDDESVRVINSINIRIKQINPENINRPK